MTFYLIASRAIPNSVMMGLIGLKIFVTLYRRDDIWNLIQELKATYEDRVRANQSVSVKFEVKKYLDEFHFCVRIYSTTFLLTLLPLMFPAIPFLFYKTMEYPITYWYPFDIYRPVTFALVLTWTDFMAWIASFCLLGCDSLVYALITVIAMEFDTITSDLRNFSAVSSKDGYKKTLASIVDRHNELLDLIDKLQDIYGLIFFSSFFISSFLMCFTGFQLSTSTDNSFFIPLLCLIIGQIFLLCFFGQKLIDSSASLADGSDCGWENFDDNEFKKDISFLILRAKKFKCFTAMKFADISLPSLTTVR